MVKKNSLFFCFTSFFFWGQIAFSWVFNNPYDEKPSENIGYKAFSSPPKTLDPAKSYSSNELLFVAQIYEAPLQYHYLKRPYSLAPRTTVGLPGLRYFNKKNKELQKPVNFFEVAYTLYDIKIKPGILYQNHPSFAQNKEGKYLYHSISFEDIEDISSVEDFKVKTTRELTAHDYVYQIKRLAHPQTTSPIYGLMKSYIVGLEALGDKLKEELKKAEKRQESFLDLREFPLAGVKVVNRYHYQIKVKGVYSQFLYWLAMPFFAPMPWEADRFYSQKDMEEKNLTLDWYPIGTGPYYLAENNPNKEMILRKNPNFHEEFYPSEGEEGDEKKGYLNDKGKKLPFVDQFIFSLEKETLPRWNKFLQGYYDKSSIDSDSFDQAIKLDKNGKALLTEELKKKKIRLQTTVSPSVYYMGFNMLDKVVGGSSERARKLRLAISIALDYEEYISIFLNGRGKVAHSPVPPGIFGFRQGKDGVNSHVFSWDEKKKRAERFSLSKAKSLMTEAGYKNGIDSKTGKALILNYDVTSSGGPGDQSKLNWMRKQYAKIGIQLNIRSTQYNRFREKVRTGNAQIFQWGWLADYPDPENFLFLLYGPNGKVKFGGENAANYHSLEFDKLFEVMKNLPNGEPRQKIIDKMVAILRKDSPWIWGYYPVDFTLAQNWNRVSKLHSMANNIYKYERINVKERTLDRAKWNKASLLPLFLSLFFVLCLFVPLAKVYLQRENTSTIKRL